MLFVATVPTVYGIETHNRPPLPYDINKLQQYLPFTVLKPKISLWYLTRLVKLQQYLPFTVLKLEIKAFPFDYDCVATVPTVYGIETKFLLR